LWDLRRLEEFDVVVGFEVTEEFDDVVVGFEAGWGSSRFLR
jgi:hypothetical protein